MEGDYLKIVYEEEEKSGRWETRGKISLLKNGKVYLEI